MCVGRGAFYRLPGYSEWTKVDKSKRIGDVIAMIEDDMACEGPSLPVFVYGYSKMRRGISFRSSERVPTHLVMGWGDGQVTIREDLSLPIVVHGYSKMRRGMSYRSSERVPT